MPVYDIDKLMIQTRRLAADYRQATGQVLPVSADLAQYDAVRLLSLQTPAALESGVDAVSGDTRYQIKSRVLFDQHKRGYRVGQLNPNGHWDVALLVLFNAQYEPIEIIQAGREQLQHSVPTAGKNNRGSLTVEKFRAVGDVIWQAQVSNVAEGGE